MGNQPVIDCRNVNVRYGRTTVLDNVTFTVPERETLCVVGPNGGGKSTLLRVLLGLKDIHSGEISILGTRPKEARIRIGYMPQYFSIDPMFPIDVEGIVLMGRLRVGGAGLFSRKDRLAAEKALEEVGLLAQRKERFMTLSGGMKQRVLIARALVNDPEILLLDEPTAMVDAHIEAKLLGQLKELHRKMTILLVSHDAAFVSSLVDEVLCVNHTAVMHRLERVEDDALRRLYGDDVQAVIHGDHCHVHDHQAGESQDD